MNRGNRHDNWSSKVRKRDKQCRACGTNTFLVAHHIKSWANFPKDRFKVDNGLTLCESCHNLLHHIYGASPTNEQLQIFIRSRK